MALEALFVRMLIGHFAGDYLSQTYNMAKQKWTKTWSGTLYCFLHASLYSLIVLLFCTPAAETAQEAFALWGLLFLTHYPVDRYSLGRLWIGIRDRSKSVLTDLKEADLGTEEGRFSIGVGPFVYIMVDNSLHLLLLWIVALYWTR